MNRRMDRVFKGQCRPVLERLPMTVEDLKALPPFEFQNWIIAKMVATPSPRKSGDMGIDGFCLHDSRPDTGQAVMVDRSECHR